MLPAFRRVEIFAFDLHSAPRLLLDSSLLQPAFGFLCDPKTYDAMHLGQIPTPVSPHFIVRSLGRELKRNHFWKHFRQILLPDASKEVNLWYLQVPFRYHRTSLTLAIETGLTSVTARVQPEILLWPAGWSSNLGITIQGDHTVQQLQGLVREILTGSPFLLDGGKSRLSTVFARLTKDFKKDLFQKNALVGDVIRVPRHLVVAITESAGPLPRYSNRFYPSASVEPLMTDGDRAEVHGALLGRQVQHQEVLQTRADAQFLETKLLDEDFALTYFQHGSLLSLSRASINRKKNPISLRCMAANVKSCFLMAQALVNLYDDAYARSQPTLAELRKAAAVALREMPVYYRNPICRGLFLNHSRLKKFQPAA